MNWSKYNFLFNSPKYGYLLYNSITNCFAQIDNETVTLLEQCKNNSELISTLFSEKEITQLKDAKIFVNSDYDEYLNIKMRKHLKRFDRTHMNLTLAPTLHCNLYCDYCFEGARPKVYMTDETEEQIIGFIQRHEEVKSLSVTWYGGEPLLNFQRIITLTKKIETLGLNYNASIITNGYLLTQEVIDQLIKLKIKYIHVTIDGPEEIHNKRRPHISEKNSFSTIYNNILKLKPYLKDRKIELTIRVNIDETNKNYYNEIYRKIRTDFENINIYIYPGIVKKNYGSCSSIDDILLDNNTHAAFNIQQFQKYNIKSSDFFPMRHRGECIARQIYGYLIDARGDIYKCWTDTGKTSESIGNVSTPDIINHNQMIRYLTGADVFDSIECQECFFLPVCGGGCPHLSLKKKMENEKIDLCHVAKGNLEAFLEIYYEIKMNKIVAI